ncbi:winged helix-turn-helix domain-containing protein [Paenibacillus wynnii]|uniref:winged helix-turn-helix domain-containing protein n=1 Tax=Paenibacillus wynnii TaxID=268407 RepID=UPI00279324B3|nr:winged helix-turn-helix domain-containing protein [Paenibacillus wynnii]MDQ0196174.1 DNA-binding transcriptional ArsR family regulator [Paenibacillus wynnii]
MRNKKIDKTPIPNQQPSEAPLPISEEQVKLLESALRIKIMHALAQEALTSKQVAEKLQKTPGNIHYHIIKLFEGGLLELVGTEAVGGIIQKFYRSEATWFKAPNVSSLQFSPEDQIEHFTTRLTLAADELERFQTELKELITKWESEVTHGNEYGVDINIGRLQQFDDAIPEPGSES